MKVISINKAGIELVNDNAGKDSDMEMAGIVERLILEAYWSGNRITFKAEGRFYEGSVEKIYEKRIVKFSIGNGLKRRTGYFLISDIDMIV